MSPQLESLESRRLLSATGLTATGPAVPVATITGGRSTSAACAVGAADVLIAYVKSNAVYGQILDSAGASVVPEFQISSNGQSANQFSRMAAATDSNGNAVLVYAVGLSSRDLYVVRINSSGQIVDAPSEVASSATHDKDAPAIAPGPSGQIAVAWVDAPSIGSATGVSIVARVLDSSDSPLTHDLTLSDPMPNTVSAQLLTHPAVIYNPAGSNYLAAWDLQDLGAGFSNLREAIETRAFTPDGTLGPDPEVASTPTDVFTPPILNATPGGIGLGFGDEGFDTSFNFGHTTYNTCFLDNNAAPTSSPIPAFVTNNPTEFLPTGALNTLPFLTVVGNSGTYNGSGISGDGVDTYVIDPEHNIFYVHNPAVFPYNQFYDPVVVPIGPTTFLGITTAYVPGSNSTIISATPASFVAPAALPTVTMSITNVTRNGDGAEPPRMIITATLSQPQSSAVTVHVTDHIPGIANLTNHPFNQNISEDLTIPAGQLSASLPIDIFSYHEGGPTSGTVSMDTLNGGSDVTIVNPVVDGTVTTVFNTAHKVAATATPAKPATVTDSDGDLARITSTDGSVSVSTDANGNLVLKTSKTNGKTKVKILKLPGGSGDGHFNIKDFISTTPLGSLDAGTTDISGNLKLNGASSITTGNIHDYHLISLGHVTNAVLKFGSLAGAALTAVGSIKSLSVTEWLGGSLTATSVGSLACAGDFDANLTVTSLGSLSVTGALGGTSTSDTRTLRATQSLGTISAASVRHALLLAGVKTSVHSLPTARSAFNNPRATLTSLTLKGATPTFSDAIIAAPTIGTLKILGLSSINPTPFGIVAEKITSYTRGTVAAKNTTKPKLLDSLDQYSARTL